MTNLGPEISSQVLEACRTNASEAAGALSRTFGGKFEVEVGDALPFDAASPPPELEGGGLVCLLKVDDAAALAMLATSSGMLPSWCAAPDASGANKLYTLALELGMVLLPEEQMPVDYQAKQLRDMPAALVRAGVGAASCIRLTVKLDDKSAPLWLVWPALSPAQLFEEPAAPPAPQAVAPAADPPPSAAAAPAAAPAAATESSAGKNSPANAGPPVAAPATPAGSAPASTAAKPLSYRTLDEGLRLLPTYSRSLLKIKVPVVVTLATTSQPVSKIMEIVPGTIIQFNKSCEEMLTLEVGNQKIALGEAVKIGDKFGLRVTEMSLPDERFLAVRGTRSH